MAPLEAFDTQREKKAEFLEMTRRPRLQILATMACNLRCSYCPVTDWLLEKPTDAFLRDPLLLDLFETAQEPYYMYMAGGEPLLTPDLPPFLHKWGARGHKFSFDSNGTHNRKVLANILDSFDTSCIGYFDISHHLDQKVPLKTIINTCEELRSRDINHYVKYLARPSDFDQIDRNVAELEARGIGVVVCLFMGPNSRTGGELVDDRRLPDEYSDAELKWLLGHARLRQHIPPMFGGLNMVGKPCIAGNDLVVLGNVETDRHKAWPCCHAEPFAVDLDKTPFRGAPRGKVPCKVNGACYAGTGMEHGFLYPPQETLADLFEGPVKPLRPDVIVDYVANRCPQVAPPANQASYDKLLKCAREMAAEA